MESCQSMLTPFEHTGSVTNSLLDQFMRAFLLTTFVVKLCALTLNILRQLLIKKIQIVVNAYKLTEHVNLPRLTAKIIIH